MSLLSGSSSWCIVSPFKRRNIDLYHRKQRIRHSLRTDRIAIVDHFIKSSGYDLPPKAELVNEPSARLLLAPPQARRSSSGPALPDRHKVRPSKRHR